MSDALPVQPHDAWSCRGCGQLLNFDDRCFVPQEQLNACRGLCDWELVERRRPVEDTPPL